MVAGGNVGCFNKNQSVPAEFYNATIQKIHFHIPSDHFIYGESSSLMSDFHPSTLSYISNSTRL